MREVQVLWVSLISVVAYPTVLCNPWHVPFPQQASRSELIPSQAQLSSQLGLLHVRFSLVRVQSGKARYYRENQQQSAQPTYGPGWKFIPGNISERRALSSLYKSPQV